MTPFLDVEDMADALLVQKKSASSVVIEPDQCVGCNQCPNGPAYKPGLSTPGALD